MSVRPHSRPALPVRALQLACFATALAVCIPVASGMPTLWTSVELMGHGYLIPFVSIFLLFSQREKISSALSHGRPGPWGWLAVLASTSLFGIALVGSAGALAGLMVPVLLLATAYAVAGPPLMRCTLVPVGFLALMVPPPHFITTELTAHLKLMVTRIAVDLLHLTGTSVASVGNQILVPGHELYVADACSGLTSIVTLVPLAAVIAYFMCGGIWRRLVVVASVMPLAVLGNVARIVVTVLMVSEFGISYAEGWLHDTFGLTTYAVGTLVLGLIARALQ